MIAADLDGRITSWNKGAERLFGYEATEIIGCSVLVLLPEELQAQFPTLVMEPLRERGQHELEDANAENRDRNVMFHLSLSLRREHRAGSVTGIIGYAIHVTANLPRTCKPSSWPKCSTSTRSCSILPISSRTILTSRGDYQKSITLLAKRYRGSLTPRLTNTSPLSTTVPTACSRCLRPCSPTPG